VKLLPTPLTSSVAAKLPPSLNSQAAASPCVIELGATRVAARRRHSQVIIFQ
jgi:hypothetical protein